jgi:DNA-directed RNA polymerase specialized sigma24 family protein
MFRRTGAREFAMSAFAPALADPTQPSRVPLHDLVAACGEETARFGRGRPSSGGAGFELFRRAICERDDGAWDAVVGQYRGLVRSWIRQQPASTATGAGGDELAIRAFERLWMAVGPERFGQFLDLASLLGYLKMCAHSVVVDEVRARRSTQVGALDELPAAADVEAPAVDTTVERRTAVHELWTAILGEVPDESERLLVYLTFALDLKPGEIHDRHPDRYPTVADVYRLKRNVLDRLRRSPRIQRFQDLVA